MNHSNKCPCCRAVDERDCGCFDEMIKEARNYQSIKHFGDPSGRTRLAFGLAERVYARRWAKENRRVSWLNEGRGSLELILSQHVVVTVRKIVEKNWRRRSEKSHIRYGTDLRMIPEVITQRDATVAAAVIQWLGTSCGSAFVHEAEREIESKRDHSRSMIRDCPECHSRSVRFRMGDSTDAQRRCWDCGHTWNVNVEQKEVVA